MARYALPDAQGHFGPYGGVFVAETLRQALDELTLAYSKAREDPEFQEGARLELEHYVGRPSPIYTRSACRESAARRSILKREDLNHTGAHKVNNTVGQALLAPQDGQAARDRRDRARPARCRDRHRRRALRHGMRRCTWARRTSRARRRTSNA
jgi:tryptophan synthase beta chain